MKDKYLSITIGGLFIALHLVFIFMTKLIVASELVLVIFLPLLSTIYSLKFNVKEVVGYSIASFCLCMLFEPIISLIYVLPSILCGLSYGFLKKNKFKEITTVYLSGLIHTFTSFLSFSFISLLFKEVDFIKIFSFFTNKEGTNLTISIYLLFILLGVLEAFITHMITNNELVRFKYLKLEKEVKTPRWIKIAFLISIVIYIVMLCLNEIYSIMVIPFIYAFATSNVVEVILNNKHNYLYYINAIMLFISIFLLNILSVYTYPVIGIIIFLPEIIYNCLDVFKYNHKPIN